MVCVLLLKFVFVKAERPPEVPIGDLAHNVNELSKFVALDAPDKALEVAAQATEVLHVHTLVIQW